MIKKIQRLIRKLMKLVHTDARTMRMGGKFVLVKRDAFAIKDCIAIVVDSESIFQKIIPNNKNN